MAVIPFPFLVDVDFNDNEMLRAVLQNLPSHPANALAGKIYFNYTDHKPYYYDGTQWVDFYGGVESLIPGKGITTSGTSDITVHVDYDGASLYVDPDTDSGKLMVKPGGVLETHLATNSVSTIKIQNNGVTFAKMQDINTMTVIGRIGGIADPGEISIVTTIDDTDDTVVVTEGAVFRYVNSQITALGQLVGDWNPDDEGNAFPGAGDGSGPGGAVQKGDYWYLTPTDGQGEMGTPTPIEVNTGDVLYSKLDNNTSQDPKDWFVVETNRDQATETILGLAKIATTAQALAGVDDFTIMTPLKTRHALNAYYINNGTSVVEATLVGDGTQSAWVITHDWDNLHVTASISDVTTGQTVHASEERLSNTEVRISFKTPPPTGQSYLVTLLGRNKSIT